MTAMQVEEDFEVDCTQTKREGVLQKLKEKNLLSYGTLLEKEIIEDLFEIKHEPRNMKEWNLTLLTLRGILNNEGFFVTSRGRGDTALYILKREEMALFNENKNKAAYENLRTRQKGLYLVDTGIFSHEDKKKLEFEILRNGHLQLEMAKKLKERCR